MKFDIDTNNLAALEKQEAELDIALGTIRYAIQHLKQKGPMRRQNPSLPQRTDARAALKKVPVATAQAFAAVLMRLSHNFNTNDLMEVMGTEHPNLGNIGIRRALAAAVVNGQLELIEEASGRRPAKYRKVNPT